MSISEIRIGLGRLALGLVPALLANLGIAGAQAQEIPCDQSLFERQRLFDSCRRQALEARGITFDGDLIVDLVGNPSGGRDQAFRAAGRSTFGVTFDLEKRHGLKGSRLRISGAYTEGQNLAEDVETIFNPAEIFGLRSARFWELHWGQKLFDGQVDVIIGRQSPAEIFTNQPPTWDYVNLGFYALGLLYNDFAFRSRPIGMWGVSAQVDPHGSPFFFNAGVYSGAPRDLQRTEAYGLDFRIQFDESTLVVAEAGIKRGQSTNSAELPATYRAGIVYNSARFNTLADPAVSKDGNVNFYLSGEQMLYREPESSSQGLTSFFIVTWPADKDINLINFYFAGGLSYTGLFERRDADRTFIGIAYAKLADEVEELVSEVFHGPAIAPNQPFEAVVEIGHAFQVTPFLAITPAAQYIINPGLTDDVDNAFVLGLQTVVTF